MLNPKAGRIWKDVVAGAKAHAEQSEPDHEVGDLALALALALKYVPIERLKNLHKELKDIIEWGKETQQ